MILLMTGVICSPRPARSRQERSTEYSALLRPVPGETPSQSSHNDRHDCGNDANAASTIRHGCAGPPRLSTRTRVPAMRRPVVPFQRTCGPAAERAAVERRHQHRNDRQGKQERARNRKRHVYAIGANNFPSTRWNVKIGRYARMMIMIEKKISRPTSCEGRKRQAYDTGRLSSGEASRYRA